MADEDRDQKTEQPTPKKLADAAQKGDVLQSRDLSAAIVSAAGFGWVIMAGPWLVDTCLSMLRAGLVVDPGDIAAFDPVAKAASLSSFPVFPVLALFAVTIATACFGPVLLGSAGFRSRAFTPTASRLNPLTGLTRVLGLQGWTELAKTLVKASLIGAIGYFIIAREFSAILSLGGIGVESGVAAAGRIMSSAMIALACGLVVIAAIDIPLQRFQRSARLRMSKQEVKDELRQSEGAPEQKQLLRQRQHELASGRKALAEATVVLTNPAHFAVALRYVAGKDSAPVVVARGRDESAFAIKTLAQERGVPTLEYPQLTRAIYFTSRAGQTVAEDLFVAVATVLAFVFQLEREQVERKRQPAVTVPPGKRFDAAGKIEPS